MAAREEGVLVEEVPPILVRLEVGQADRVVEQIVIPPDLVEMECRQPHRSHVSQW